MKKILTIIFAFAISLAAFAVVACENPDDDQPEYVKIDSETFASAIEAYGDVSNYAGVEGYKFDLDIDLEKDLSVWGETAVGKDVMTLSGLLNFADLSDVEFSLDMNMTEKVIYGEESEETQLSMKWYLYDEGLFIDALMDFDEEQYVENVCISDFTNDFESVMEMLMPLENNPPFIEESDTEMTEEELAAEVMAMLDQNFYDYAGMTLEEILTSHKIGDAMATEYLSEKLAITYCASLGHYVLEINVSEEVELRYEGSAIELPGFNLKVGLFTKENRITKFTVDFNVPDEEEPFLQFSLSCGETTEKIVKPTNIEDYDEMTDEDGESLFTQIKVGYESFMEFVQMISNSRDNTLEFYASTQYEVEIFYSEATGTLTFPTNNTILLSGDLGEQLLEVQFMYSVIIVAVDEDGNAGLFIYNEATEEDYACFLIVDLQEQAIVGIAYDQ